jgi:hypothetical protein
MEAKPAEGAKHLTVDRDDPPYAGVTLTGRADLLPPGDFDYATLVKELAVEYLGAEMGGQYGEMIAGVPGEHVTLALYPEHWESWDYSR